MNPTKQDDPSEEFADELADEPLDRVANAQGACPVGYSRQGSEMQSADERQGKGICGD